MTWWIFKIYIHIYISIYGYDDLSLPILMDRCFDFFLEFLIFHSFSVCT
jgi:hypothetical protein